MERLAAAVPLFASPHIYDMVDRVVRELRWYRGLRGMTDDEPRRSPDTANCAEDIKRYLLRFWPRLPRLSGKAVELLSSQAAFWNRIAMQRLRFQGERHWYLVAHAFDTGERIFIVKVPPPSFASHQERVSHASCQMTYNDDANGRHAPGVNVSDKLADVLLESEQHLREGLLTGFPIIKLGSIPKFVGKNYQSCEEHREAAGALLDRQIAVGAMEGPLHYTPTNCCSLGCIYTPPPKDKYRNVWDLTASGVNPHTFVPTTVYDLLSDVLKLQRPRCWQSGFDQSDAFWNWPRRQADCDYIGVTHPITGAMYRARFAVFGASDSPYIQAAVTRVVKRILNTEGLKYCQPGPASDYSKMEVTGIFVDDGHIVHDEDLTYEEAEDQLLSIIRVMADYGIKCSAKKTQYPAKIKEFVGINIDSVKQEVSVTPLRAERYTAVLDDTIRELESGSKPTIGRADFASVVGKLQYCAELVPGGQGLLGELYRTRDNLSRYDFQCRTTKGQWRKDVTITTDSDTPRQLRLWKGILSRPVSRRYYLPVRPSERGFWKGHTEDTDEYLDHHWSTSEGIPAFRMDASKRTGAIAYLDDRCIHQFPEHECHPHESSNYRELSCILHGLQRWGHLWAGRRVLGRSDNSTTVTVIRKQGTVAPRLMALSREIQRLAEYHRIELGAIHIAGKVNVLADRLSRYERRYEVGDWMFDPSEFASHDAALGPHTVDAQCDPVGGNAQLPRYYSEADSCYEHDLAHEAVWANPDFAQLERFLLKFREDYHSSPHDTSLTLVCPAWTERRFWRLLKGGRLVAKYPAGSLLYSSPDWRALRREDGRFSMDNLRIARGPTAWDTLVIHFPRALGRCAAHAAPDPREAAADDAYRRLLAPMPTLSGRPHDDLLVLSYMPPTTLPAVQPIP